MVRALSDDWYLVRLHGRAAEQDSADDHGLSVPAKSMKPIESDSDVGGLGGWGVL